MSLLLLPPQEQDSLHSFPVTAWGSSHRRQFPMSFSDVGPSHGLQFFMNCSSLGPFHGMQSFRSRLLQHGFPTASQVLSENLLQHGILFLHRSTGPAKEPASAQASHRVIASLSIHLLQHGVLHGLQVDICSTVDLHGVQGDSLPHHGLHHRLHGNLCSGTWSNFSPSFFADLGVCRVISLTCSPLSLLLLHMFFSPPS